MPIRLIGKVSLSDEIKMLEMLRGMLLSAQGQARLIAASTGDEFTKARLADIAQRANEIRHATVYLIAKAEADQEENDAEAGREVTLQEDLGR